MIAEQAKLILAAIQDNLLGADVRAFVASDPIDCLDRLRMKPGVGSCAVLWVSEEPREPEFLGRVDETWKVVVSRGRSLKLQPGDSLIEGAAGGPPMFELVETIRNAVLSLRMPAEDGFGGADLVPAYRGSGPFEVNGMLLDAVEIRFTLAGQIPPQTSDD